MGYQGPQGEKGPTGEKGCKGPKGDRGEKGDIGDKGIIGDDGDMGDKGDKGEDAIYDPGLDGVDGKEGKNGDDLVCNCKEDEFKLLICRNYFLNDFGHKCHREILVYKNCLKNCLQITESENGGCENENGHCRSRCDKTGDLVICDSNNEATEREDCRKSCDLQKDNCDRTENCADRKFNFFKKDTYTREDALLECQKLYPKNIIPYTRYLLSINTPKEFLTSKQDSYVTNQFYAKTELSNETPLKILLTENGYQIKKCINNKYYFLDAERKLTTLDTENFSEIISKSETGVNFNLVNRLQSWSFIYNNSTSKYSIKFNDPNYGMCNWVLEKRGGVTGEPFEDQIIIKKDGSGEWEANNSV